MVLQVLHLKIRKMLRYSYYKIFNSQHIFQGGVDNLELARAHYSYAILLNPNNIRALYGLYLVIVLNCLNVLNFHLFVFYAFYFFRLLAV